MRVLLDESLPRQLKAELSGHQVHTVPELGWAGKKNGELLRLADERFDAFVTPDKNLPHQQNLSALRLCIIVVSAASTTFEALVPLVPELLRCLEVVQPGRVVRLSR